MAEPKKPKRKLLTRTRMAKAMGMTVPVLKKHLVAAGLLDATGRMPSIAAYLKGAVEWRVMAADEMERFFLFDLAVVEELAPGLADAGDPNHVHSRHAAASILGGAGELLLGASTGDPEDPDRLTPSTGWLLFENWECVVQHSAEEKRAFAARLERVLASVDAEVAAGLIDAVSPLVAPAREAILSVISWFRGERRPTGRPIVSGLAAHPVPVRVLDSETRARLSSVVGGGVSVALSPDESVLLSGGHVFRMNGPATDLASRAIEKACETMVASFASPSNPYSPCECFRMSTDGRWLFACERVGMTIPWVFPAEIVDGAVVVGPCGPDVPDAEFERLGLDIDDGIVGLEHAIAVTWRSGMEIQ